VIYLSPDLHIHRTISPVISLPSSLQLFTMQASMMTQRTSRVAVPRSRTSTVVVRAANIIDTAKAQGLTSFASAVESAGLASTLNGAGPFTVFVPTNEAFAAYDGKDPHFKTNILLTDTLLMHVVKGKTEGRHLENFANIRSMADIRFASLAINKRIKKGSLKVGSPEQGTQGLAGNPLGGFILGEIPCDNGIIHVVDGVIKPQEVLPANNGSGSAGASAAW
jgi:uncharacterized surface protein with fasciclin (FAS1) repeats